MNAFSGVQLWNYSTSGGVYSSPAVVNNVVYVGSANDKVYALNTANGAQIWNYTTGGQVYSSPAVSGGVVYVGSDDGNIYALNATNGAKIWNYSTGGFVEASPAVAGGTIYIGSYDHTVYALNTSSGFQLWNYSTGGGVSSSAAVVNGVVYVGSFDGNVYALNAFSGVQLWNYSTGSFVETSPAVVSGVVYIGSDDNNIYALGSLAPFPDHFVFSYVGSQTDGEPFNVSINAVDASGNTVTSYSGLVSLTTSAGFVNPSSATCGFSNGIWTGLVTLATASSGVTLGVDDGNGHNGISNSFVVNPIITASAGTNGAISPTGNVSVNFGDSQNFTITPNNGYSVASLIVDGSAVSVSTLYTFSNVQSFHNITATFALTQNPTPTPSSSPIPTSTPTAIPTTANPTASPTQTHTPDPTSTPTIPEIPFTFAFSIFLAITGLVIFCVKKHNYRNHSSLSSPTEVL